MFNFQLGQRLEWELCLLQPWAHYVPIQVDHSNLHSLVFFMGGFKMGRLDGIRARLAMIRMEAMIGRGDKVEERETATAGRQA